MVTQLVGLKGIKEINSMNVIERAFHCVEIHKEINVHEKIES